MRKLLIVSITVNIILFGFIIVAMSGIFSEKKYELHKIQEKMKQPKKRFQVASYDLKQNNYIINNSDIELDERVIAYSNNILNDVKKKANAKVYINVNSFGANGKNEGLNIIKDINKIDDFQGTSILINIQENKIEILGSNDMNSVICRNIEEQINMLVSRGKDITDINELLQEIADVVENVLFEKSGGGFSEK